MLEPVPNTAPDDAPACDHCGERFPRERLRDLHRGLEHDDDLSSAEVESFEDAYLAEEGDLRTFRLKALGALVVLYFVFLFAYSLFA